MKIDWERTSDTRISIYPLIISTLIIGWLFGAPFWVKFGLALLYFKLLDVVIDVSVSAYKHFKDKKVLK